MENKDYVSYDVAKLLEKKGCPTFTDTTCIVDEKTKERIDVPTLWNAQKWLREKHKTDVLITFDLDDETKEPLGYSFDIWQNSKFMDFCMEFKSYEAALDEGIKRALKYI